MVCFINHHAVFISLPFYPYLSPHIPDTVASVSIRQDNNVWKTDSLCLNLLAIFLLTDYYFLARLLFMPSAISHQPFTISRHPIHSSRPPPASASHVPICIHHTTTLPTLSSPTPPPTTPLPLHSTFSFAIPTSSSLTMPCHQSSIRRLMSDY